LFTPSQDGNANLQREGIPDRKVRLVGNVMIDTLIHVLPQAMALPKNGFPAQYALVTLHRPSNVDDPDRLRLLVASLSAISQDLPVVFPVHPRTRQRMDSFNIDTSKLYLHDPLSYLEFLALQARAKVVITDSGGIQEETTYMGIPCLTMRENTERPVTVEVGTNVLVGTNLERLETELKNVLNGQTKAGAAPPLWDGHAAKRIANVVFSDC
jgi:UDP-N-acetylglucosamine 2-epimerase (non-hydrolysing)